MYIAWANPVILNVSCNSNPILPLKAILSEAKDLSTYALWKHERKILRYAQNDIAILSLKAYPVILSEAKNLSPSPSQAQGSRSLATSE